MRVCVMDPACDSLHVCSVMVLPLHASGLYTVSLVLHVHVVGDFGSAPEGSLTDSDARWCGIEQRCPGASALMCLEEILIVPAYDVGALIDEATENTRSRRQNDGEKDV